MRTPCWTKGWVHSRFSIYETASLHCQRHGCRTRRLIGRTTDHTKQHAWKRKRKRKPCRTKQWLRSRKRRWTTATKTGKKKRERERTPHRAKQWLRFLKEKVDHCSEDGEEEEVLKPPSGPSPKETIPCEPHSTAKRGVDFFKVPHSRVLIDYRRKIILVNFQNFQIESAKTKRETQLHKTTKLEHFMQKGLQ